MAPAFALATAAGVACSVFGATFWRKLVIAVGFPLSLLVSGAAVMPAWARVSQGDIWQADWSSYDLVYLFQRPESMSRAVAKAAVELRPGAWLVSLAFAAEELEVTAVIQGADSRPVWLYQAPFRRTRKR